jgi:hypothetical protein
MTPGDLIGEDFDRFLVGQGLHAFSVHLIGSLALFRGNAGNGAEFNGCKRIVKPQFPGFFDQFIDQHFPMALVSAGVQYGLARRGDQGVVESLALHSLPASLDQLIFCVVKGSFHFWSFSSSVELKNCEAPRQAATIQMPAATRVMTMTSSHSIKNRRMRNLPTEHLLLCSDFTPVFSSCLQADQAGTPAVFPPGGAL